MRLLVLFLVVANSLGYVTACKKRSEVPSAFLRDELTPEGTVTNAYIAINGRGTGSAVFGHGYLVLSYNGSSLAESTSYHFYVSASGGEPANLADVQDVNLLLSANPENPLPISRSMPFSFSVHQEAFSASLMRASYQENRNMFVYRLNLPSNQLQALGRAIREEAASRRDNPRYDYNVVRFNCVHALTGVVNSILPDQKKISMETGWFSITPATISDSLNFVPMVMLYHLEHDRPDLISREGIFRITSGQLVNANALASFEQVFNYFFDYVLTNPIGLRFSPGDRERLLLSLINNVTALSAIEVVHNQVFLRARTRNDNPLDAELVRLSTSIQCDALRTTNLRISRAHYLVRDAIAAIHLVDRESAIALVRERPNLFTQFLELDNQQLDQALQRMQQLSSFQNFRERLTACSVEDRESLKQYLLTHFRRNLLYEFYRQVVAKAQTNIATERVDPAYRTRILQRVFQDAGSL